MRTSAVVLAVASVLLLAGVTGSLRISEINREALIRSVPFERILHASGEPENWLTYSGTYASNRYSELAQIAPDNVKDLALVWSLPSRDTNVHEAVTPLVVDGVMFTVQRINDVVALDAATGRIIWRYIHKPDPAARNCCAQVTRGLAILDHTLFLATLDARIIALDAATGRELWNVPVADPTDRYAYTHAPLVVKDTVIEGTSGGEFGIRGFISAFDAATGKERWRFHPVPGPGERGNETWAGDSWQHGGGPVWVTGSYDPETNLTFWGVGNPGPDYNGDARAGDNLFTCSVVALDADNGQLKWFYQFSPHNEFDWDSAQVPVLTDLVWKGQSRKVMLWANRSGMFYVLDRTTGEFLLGKPFARLNWATGFDDSGRPIPSSPTIFSNGSRVYPDPFGATNWFSPSYSPRTGLFYIPTRDNSSAVVSKGQPPEYRRGQSFSGPASRSDPTDAGGAYGAIRAIDPLTGEKKWDYRPGAAQIRAGVLTTASDLLFSGSQDGRFYALSARDGSPLWEARLDSPISAGPMTFAVAGRQYVAIQAQATLFTFARAGGH